MRIEELRDQHCAALKGAEHKLSGTRVETLLEALPGWETGPDRTDIRKQFRFDDFLHALSFVNALGWIAERENHHPDLELGWGRCTVHFSTHDVGGLSMNDFICAAKAQALADA